MTIFSVYYSMTIIVLITAILALFMISKTKKLENFTETSYYYAAAPGSRGERMVCMPESQGQASLGIALKKAAEKLRAGHSSSSTIPCNATTPSLITNPPSLIQEPPQPPPQPPRAEHTVECPPGSYWNGSSCTGIVDQPVCDPGFQYDGVRCRKVVGQVDCPQGYTWDGDSCAPPPQQSSCPTGYVDNGQGMCILPQAQCPPGSSFNGTACVQDPQVPTPTPMQCPPGSTYNGTVCVQTPETPTPQCPDKYKFDPARNMCVFTDPKCPTGYIWDASKGMCRAPVNPKPPTGPTCPDGYEYDETSEQCLYTGGVQCPEGYIWDTAKGMCRLNKATKACPDGYEYDETSEQCLYTSGVQCPEGYIWDTAKGMCRLNTPTNTCPEGYQYDETIDQCRFTGGVQCPVGYQWDASKGMCGLLPGGGNAPEGFNVAPTAISNAMNVSGRPAVGKASKDISWQGYSLKYRNYRIYIQQSGSWYRLTRKDGVWYISKTADSSLGGGGGGGGGSAPEGFNVAPTAISNAMNKSGRPAVGKASKDLSWQGYSLKYRNYRIFIKQGNSWYRLTRKDGVWYIAKNNGFDTFTSYEGYPTKNSQTFEDRLLGIIDG